MPRKTATKTTAEVEEKVAEEKEEQDEVVVVRRSKRKLPEEKKPTTKATADKKSKKSDLEPEEDDLGVGEMDLGLVKELLGERDMSIEGSEEGLRSRLLIRLKKEQDPDYLPEAEDGPRPTGGAGGGAALDAEEAEAGDGEDDEDSGEERDDPVAKAAAVAAVEALGIDAMSVKGVKDMLKERDLSIKGTEKVLKKRLIDRLIKEQDPAYKPKPKFRTCKWCGAYMKKRNGFKGEFYGCSTFPACQYTTSMSGHANPKREHLRGREATGGGAYAGLYGEERWYAMERRREWHEARRDARLDREILRHY